MQDIVPKKSIREITKPHIPGALLNTKSQHVQTGAEKVTLENEIKFDEYPHEKINTSQKKPGWGRVVLFFAVISLIGIAIFLHFQKSATIFVTPEQETLTFKNNEIVIPIADIVTLTAEATSTIDIKTSTGTPILTKAKGTVTIYNANSTEQSLVARTRLEAPNGKIYRLDTKVVVPKASLVNGKSVPGSIQALVTADMSGEAYNTTQSDFTFPGLVGSPRYKNVYARTKGAISGGSEVKTTTIDEKDKNQKIEALIKEKTESLKAEVMTKKPTNMISVHESPVTTTFEKVSDTKGTVVLQVTMKGIDAKKFASILAKNQKSSATTLMEFVSNSESLRIEYISESKTDFRIKVDGSVTVKTDIPEEEIKNILTGKPFTQFRNLIKAVDGVQEVSFTSKPFWASSFPQVSRIVIEEK